MSFLASVKKLLEGQPRPPATIWAVYECRLCNEQFDVDPRDQYITAHDRFWRVEDTEAFKQTSHRCHEKFTGIADFQGMRKV